MTSRPQSGLISLFAPVIILGHLTSVLSPVHGEFSKTTAFNPHNSSYGYQTRQINVLFRHGDRNPETFPRRFPNDPNMFDSFYPSGSGGLTNLGKMRMYRLGVKLRRNYDNFVGPNFIENEVFAISSNVARTKMSLQLVLAGLCSPALGKVASWNKNLDWTPLPTITISFKDDRLFSGDKCNRAVEEYYKIMKSNEIQSKLIPYTEFLRNLQRDAGKNSSFSMTDILLLHNNLEIENEMNLPMKSWMVQALADGRLKSLRQIYYKVCGFNSLMRRFKSGFFIKRITEDMLTRDWTNRKISLYSGHDNNIISILQSFDLYDGHFPEFGSALIFELLEKAGRFFVKLIYEKSSESPSQILRIPGCTYNECDDCCPMNDFLKLIIPLVMNDEEVNCEKSSGSYFTESD